MTFDPSASIGKSEILPAFPTYLWKYQLKPEASALINRRVLAKLDEITGSAGELRPGSKWQTDQNLHELPEFEELSAQIRLCTRGVLDYLKIPVGQFLITGCWANIGAPGSPHGAHSHPNNYLSGVYYVSAPKGADTITFHDPRPQLDIILPAPSQLAAENAGKVILKVEEGTLLIFPSWLQHSVAPNMSQERRVSIAFNIMFAAFAETMSRPQWNPHIGDDVDAETSRYRFPE